MKIARINIRNILGITELEVQAGGTITEITGKNGTGKTSVLEAIKGALQGGHDATLLRHGAEEGEVVLVLDDEAGTQIRKRVTATGSTTSLYQNDKKVPSPAGAIKALVDVMSVNPVEFLTAPAKDRVKVLLETVPLKLDIAHLQKISGLKLAEGASHMHPLQIIDWARQTVFDDRTGTNRALKEKEGTINQLSLALPAVPEGIEGNEDDLRAHVQRHTEARDTELARIQTKWDGIQAESSKKVDDIKTEANKRIEAIRNAAQAEIDAERSRVDGIREAADKQREKARTTHAAAVEPLNTALATIVANRNAFARREQAQETIRELETQAHELREDAEKQTAAINAIDGYKSELLAKLPIPGLTVTDGQVIRNGIPFDRLNTAQQVDIAVEIAKLRAGKLAVCCVDRFEALDPDTLAEFKVRAEASGLQLFVTRVGGEDFTVSAQ